MINLAAPSKLIRKVLKLPGSIWAQDNVSRSRRQSNSAWNVVQICGHLCKIPAEGSELFADRCALSASFPSQKTAPSCGTFRSAHRAIPGRADLKAPPVGGPALDPKASR